METLKQSVFFFFLLLSITGRSQNSETVQQKAYSVSYLAEYKQDYNAAIQAVKSVYQENAYEDNLRLGWLNYLLGNFSTSQTYYTKAVNLKPASVEARLGLIKPLSSLESWDFVLKQYQEILKLDPGSYAANYWSGVIHYNRKQYEVAVKFFEKIVNYYPFDYDAAHMLAWNYYFMSKTNEARIMFNKALLIRPGDSSAIQGLSLLK
jgi:tetratricopeptide (TPR) repeat protein